MNKAFFKLVFLFYLSFLMFESQAQVSEYLIYTTDFNGSTNWNLGTKTNKWIINNQYNCAGTFTSNTPNNSTGNYLHVYSETSLPLNGGTCACHSSTSPSETVYANLTSALNTLGFDSVVVSFNWICGGNSTNFGFLQISNDGGQNYTTITSPRQYFNSQSTWTNIVIHSNHVPQLLNNPALVVRFGFTSGNSRSNPAFGIDNLAIRAFSTSSEFRTQVVDMTNELCSNTSTGAARVLATGGQHPYSYQWYNINENQTISNNDSIISNLEPGNYRVIISDAINQSDTNYFIIQSIYPSPTITAGENDTICYGETVGLTATGGVYYTWEPSSEIIGTNQIANPTASPDSTTMFIVTAKAPVADLINNGDFSGGNTGFSSDYGFYTTYSGGPGGMNDGNYAISNCPSDANSSWWACNGQDHTGGAGNMMIVNGASTAGVNVWCQTQEVLPNTDYAFSTWLSTMHPQNPSILQFSINGLLLGSPFNASSTTCDWNQFYEIWNSQHNTIATICIVNMNTAISGNDFALDDIFFSPLCPGQDTSLIAISHPQAFAGNDTLSCDASAITLTASGGETYQWNTFPVSNTEQITVSPSVPTTYSVTVTDRHGCTDIDEVSVDMGSYPEINLGTDTVLCPGNTLIIDASHPLATGYLWNDASTEPQRTISTTGIFSVTVFSNCGNVTDSISVIVSPPLVFAIYGDTATCEGTIVSLTTNSGFDSYLWSNNETTDSIQVTSSGTYSITATDTNACTFFATHNLTVFPNPVFTLKDTLICNQTEYTIQGPSGFDDYTWSNGNLSQNIIVSLDGAYILTATDENGCSATQTANINFGTITDINLGNDTLFCEDNFLLTLSPGNTFSTYLWSTGQNTSSIQINQAGTYSVTVSDIAGCTARDTISLTMGSYPEINLGPDTVICPGGTLTLDASHPLATGYLWNDSFTAPQRTIVASGTYSVTVFSNCGNVTDSISVTLSQSFNFDIFGDTTACEGTIVALSTNRYFESYLWSTNETTDTIYVTSPGTYSISATDTNTCTFSATHHLSVFPNPVFTLDDVLVCNQTEYTIQGPTGTYNYVWSNSALTQNITVNQNGQYSLTVTDGNDCNATQTANINFGSITDISLGNDTVFCENMFTLTLTPGNNFTTYLWNTGQNTPSIQANQAGSYSVTVSDDVSCTANASISISVIPLSPIDLGEDISICNIESLILDAGLNIGNYPYTWSNGTQTSSTIVNQAGTYWVKYGDENCMVSDTIEVIGCPDIIVPNVFTPNGDGSNDRFVPEASAIENFVMKIYNRWGTPIFETTDYIEGWNGKINGKEASEGVYYWIIQYHERFSDSEEKTLSGSVSLVR